MPKKISALPAGSALTGAELVPLVQSGATIRSTVTAVYNYVASIFAASTGAAGIGFAPLGTSAVATTLEEVARRSVNVFNFLSAAQKADVLAYTFTLDVSAAVQAAINYLATLGGGTLITPAGLYRLDTAVVPCNFLTVQGDSATLSGSSPRGTFFLANNTIGAFTATAIQKLVFRHVGFMAFGPGVGVAYAYQQTVLTNYSERCVFENVNVWANMAGGFFGNFILTTWRRCEFGYYSTTSGQFWPIYSKGDILGNQTNANLIDDCYIRASLRSNCVYFEAGSDLTIRSTRFEGCRSVTAINLLGILTSTIEGCYFEDCNAVGTLSLINYGNDTTAAQGCSAINFFVNYGSLSSNNTHLISHAGASGSINALGNRFEGLAGKQFVISVFFGNNAPFSAYLGNVTAGFTGVIEDVVALYKTWAPTVTSFTGTLTTVSAVGTSIKKGNQVTLNAVITVTTNGTGATLLVVKNLPYVPKVTSVIRYAGTGYTNNNATALAVTLTDPGTPEINIYKYDGTYPSADGFLHVISITYETV